MNAAKIAAFADYVRRQAAGDETAEAAIRALAVTTEDGYCLFNLVGEWKSAFSYVPGRREALAPILALADRLTTFDSDEPLELYRSPEWGRLVELRGPSESVLTHSCTQCGTQFVGIGTSGFLDMASLVCPGCGNVYFKSTYDDSAVPACSCGGTYVRGCPGCGASGYSPTTSEISPYEYFASHEYVRAPGA